MYTRKGPLYHIACPEAKVGYLAQGGWVKGFGFWFLHPMYCLLGRPTPVPIRYRALSCTFALHPCGVGRVAPTKVVIGSLSVSRHSFQEMPSSHQYPSEIVLHPQGNLPWVLVLGVFPANTC